MTAVVLALVSSLAYGASDYASGRLVARLSAAQIVLITSATQGLVLAVAAFAAGGVFSAVGFGGGALGGLVGAVALMAYYNALARGPAGIVAPIVSTSSALPVLVSVLLGAAPGPVTITGLLGVLVGLVILTHSADTGSQSQPGEPTARPVMLALMASLCFGLAFIVIDAGADRAPQAAWWVLCGVQVGALPAALVATGLAARGRSRERWASFRAARTALTIVAILNLVADGALVFALRAGEVAVVSVLSSLAPAVTIGLSHVLVRERLTRPQTIGALVTFVATLLVIASAA